MTSLVASFMNHQAGQQDLPTSCSCAQFERPLTPGSELKSKVWITARPLPEATAPGLVPCSALPYLPYRRTVLTCVTNPSQSDKVRAFEIKSGLTLHVWVKMMSFITWGGCPGSQGSWQKQALWGGRPCSPLAAPRGLWAVQAGSSQEYLGGGSLPPSREETWRKMMPSGLVPVGWSPVNQAFLFVLPI